MARVVSIAAALSLLSCSSTEADLRSWQLERIDGEALRPSDKLRIAVERNDAAAIHAVLDDATPGLLEESSDWPGTPLHLAVQSNWLDAAQALLERGADASARNENGDTPLYFARSPEMVHLLCRAGADVTAANAQGKPVGAIDSSVGHAMARRTVAALTHAGAEEDLATAVRCRTTRDVKRILERGPRLDPCLLHYAAMRGHVEITRALLASGASVGGSCSGRFFNVSEFGSNPLTTAIQNGNFDVAAVLLEAGAKPDGGGWPDARHGAVSGTVLARAAQDAPVSVVRALLEAGADPEGRTPQGGERRHSPLARAAGHGHDKVVRLLHRFGADVDQNSYGVTALINAAVMGRQSTVDLLLRLEAKRTLLAMVMAGRLDDVRRMLADDVAEIDEPDGFCKRTPLFWAVALGHADIARTLLEAGAKPGADPDPTAELRWRTLENWYDEPWCMYETSARPVEQAIADRRMDLTDLLVAYGAELTPADLEHLAKDPNPRAESLLVQQAAKGLAGEAWIAILRGVVRSELPLSERRRRFDRFLALGARHHLRSAAARSLFEDVDTGVADLEVIHPFLPKLRRVGWRPDLLTASQLGWHEVVAELAPAASPERLYLATRAAIAGNRPRVLGYLRSVLVERSHDPDFRKTGYWAGQVCYHGGRLVLRDMIARGEVDLEVLGGELLRDAAWSGWPGIVADLLHRGAKQKDILAALEAVSISEKEGPAVLRLLLDHARGLDRYLESGYLLQEVLRRGPSAERIECANILLEAGANPIQGETLAWIESWESWESDPKLRAALSKLATACRKREWRPRRSRQGR